MVQQVMALNFKRRIAEAEKAFQTTLTIYKEQIQKRHQEIKLHYKDCR